MKGFFAKYKKWILVGVILLVGILASRTLFRHNYYFNMHDDLQMMRQLELEKCFKDLQIPCRWVPDMGYVYGLPLYNYYPQLPYLFGEIFRLVSLPFNDVAKLTFALGIIASGFTMYLLASEFFGVEGGILSSVFYIWAPYHAVDVYVRGAMNESWAFIWFPLILWGIYKVIKDYKLKHLIILSVSLASILLTHNIMVMIFIPVALTWAIGWLIESKKYIKPMINLAISGVFGLGLSSFFTLPAIFEQKYVHIDSLVSGYFQFAGHFATFNQLFFSTFWGDGPSVFGPNDGLAFPVGQIHWILIVLIIVLLIIKFVKTKKLSKIDLVAIFGIIVGTGGAFMSHERSTFIWLAIPTLKFVQFPWRFLTLSAFGYSFAVGAIIYGLKELSWLKKSIWQILLVSVLSIIVISYNWRFFTPIHGGPLTDTQKFSGEAWRLQTQAGILDYLPIQTKDDPDVGRKELADVVVGKGTVSDESWGTDWLKFDTNITASSSSTIRVNQFDFPNWRAFVDGKETKVYVDDKEIWGRMYISVPTGKHSVYLKLYNTPLRIIANIISIISWLILLFLPLWGKKMLQFKRE